MLKIRFDPDFDGGAWPGPLAGRAAAAGEAWLGVLGLLDQLELATGLAGQPPTAAERAARLVPGLRRVEGFWSRSVEVDPLGSARELLRWRDELVLAGWDGTAEGMPARIAALTRLAPDVLPGLPDRLRAVEAALAHRSAEIEALELLEPRHALPHAWQAIVRGLEAQGTAVIEVVLEPAPAGGDLAAARAPGFAPARDGSLQLLRSDGPWAAAVEVAAWLAPRGSTDGVVVVSPTPLLDTELRRFGLPTTGARQLGGGSALLEVLPLVIALGWKPAAPEDAAALLSLPESPVPLGVRNRLRRALSEWPAVGSRDWDEALAAGLAAIEEPGRRERVSVRLHGIFDATVARGAGYPVAEIRRRIVLVRDWLRARRATLEESANANLARALDEALAHSLAFERIVDLAGLERWSAANLQRFLDESRASLAPEPVWPAEAGLAAVASPSAVAGPARAIVWWDFSRGSAPGQSRVPFSAAERKQLAAVGVALPAPADQAIRNAERWRRPLDQAREQLLLVSPRADEAGEESHPHPLWDEIAARIDAAAPQRARLLAGSLHAEPRPALVEEPLRPLPAPVRLWRLPAAGIELPTRASHSSVEDLLRCPFKWVVGRAARLESPGDVEAGISSRLLGKLAHALLEGVLPAAGGDASAARRLAEQWFEEQAPLRVAALFLPGREAEAARVRRTLADAAELFTEFVGAAGLELRHVEQAIEGSGLGRSLFGIPDLVLGPWPVVVDAKWGGFTYRRNALEKGTATQLAFYAHLLGQQPGFEKAAVSVAFFVLSRGLIVTNDPDLGSRAEAVNGPSHAETWRALERAFEARLEELRGGVVLATANPDEAGEGVASEDALEAGALVLAPQCRWCDYGGLCGERLSEAT